jgi:SPP1 gp7 family putative phage head morphogenesis protein
MAERQPKRLASDKGIVGKPLIPSAAIGDKYAKAVQALIREMARETAAELKAMFAAPGYALDGKHDHIEDGSPAARSQIILNKLMKKYRGKFDDLATMATDRMIKATLKHVDVTSGLSLRELGAGLELPDYWSARLREIVAASTKEAVQLIKTIPERFLSQVQGETMRSITSGRGMADLTPFLAEKYGQNMRKAKNVALDQTRKAYSNLAAQRMQDAGVEEFEWRHSNGGHDPRKQHQGWNGKVFRYDDPPVDETFGPVLPGQAINCRCFARPVLKFGDNRNGT